MTTEVRTNGATTLSRMTFSGYVAQVTIVSWLFTISCCVLCSSRVRVRFSSGWLAVIHTYLYYFRLSFSYCRLCRRSTSDQRRHHITDTNLHLDESRLQQLLRGGDTVDVRLLQQLSFTSQLSRLTPDVSKSACDVIAASADQLPVAQRRLCTHIRWTIPTIQLTRTTTSTGHCAAVWLRYKRTILPRLGQIAVSGRKCVYLFSDDHVDALLIQSCGNHFSTGGSRSKIMFYYVT